MKKIMIVVLLLGLVIMVGCQPEPTLKERLDNIDRMVEKTKEDCKDVLGEEKCKEIWGDDEEVVVNPDVKVDVTASCDQGLVSVDVTVKNKKSSKIFVCSSDFTLKLPGGLVVNPTSGSVNTFEGTELNNGEKVQGFIYFEHNDIGKSGIYYLNFNHHSGLQQFGFRQK